VGNVLRVKNHTGREAFGWMDPGAALSLRTWIRVVPQAFGRTGPKRRIGPSGQDLRGSRSLRVDRPEARNRAFGLGAARIGKPLGGAVRNVGNGLRAWNHAGQEAQGRKGPKRGKRPSGREPRGSESLRAERSERGEGPSGREPYGHGSLRVERSETWGGAFGLGTTGITKPSGGWVPETSGVFFGTRAGTPRPGT